MAGRGGEPVAPHGSHPSPGWRDSPHAHRPPSTHLHPSPAGASPTLSGGVGFGVGGGVAEGMDLAASNERLRPVVLQVLSTLTLSPDAAVSQFAQSLLKTERGIRSGSSMHGAGEEGGQMWCVMKVAHDFCPTSGADHLTISAGDKVIVQSVGQRGWSYGRVIIDRGGAPVPHRAGWFPTAYAKVCEEACPQSTAEEQPTGLVTAVQSSELHSTPGAPGHALQFRAGEIIAVWQEGGGGWLLGSVVMSADGSLEAKGERGWFAAGLTTRFPPPLRLHSVLARPNTSWAQQDGTLDDYSPFAKPAPLDFPVSPGPAHRRIGDSRQQSMWEDVNTPAHNTAVQSIMDSQAIRLGCEHTSRSTPLLTGNGLVRDRDSGDDHVNANKDLDLSDSDSDDDLTALTTDTQNTFARSAGDLSFADHELYQRAATIFPHVYGDRRRSLHTGQASANAAPSTSPRYDKSRSLSAVDDVTVHVNVTFTNDALESDQRELSLRRLAASLITSICRRLSVSERRFKVANCCGKMSIVLDVLPYYVVSPSEAGAEISASQLGRKIVSLSRRDVGWVATMTPESAVATSGFGIQADVICLEMTAAEAAALREQQMNELSPSASEASAKSDKGSRTYFPDPKVSASDHHGGSVAASLDTSVNNHTKHATSEQSEVCGSRTEDKDDKGNNTREYLGEKRRGGRSDSSLKGPVSTFAALQPPRIALRIVAAENLPEIPGLPAGTSRPFVTLTVLASSSGDVTVCTKPVARGAAANDSSDYDDSIYSSQPDTARWNEQFVIDVQPDEIYGSKIVIELCERLPSGDDLVVGFVFPPIGLEDLVRARNYDEWISLVDAETREPLLGTNGAQTRLRLEASFSPTRASTDPSLFDITAEDARSPRAVQKHGTRSYANLGGAGHDWQAIHDAHGRIDGWELAPSDRAVAQFDSVSPRGSKPASNSDCNQQAESSRQSHDLSLKSAEELSIYVSSAREESPRRTHSRQGSEVGRAKTRASPRSADKKREIDVLMESLKRYSMRDSPSAHNKPPSTRSLPGAAEGPLPLQEASTATAGPSDAREKRHGFLRSHHPSLRNLAQQHLVSNAITAPTKEHTSAPDTKTGTSSSPGMSPRDVHAQKQRERPPEQDTRHGNRLLASSSSSSSSLSAENMEETSVNRSCNEAVERGEKGLDPIRGWAEALAWAGKVEREIERPAGKPKGPITKTNAVEAVETLSPAFSSAVSTPSAHEWNTECLRSTQEHGEKERGQRGVVESEREESGQEGQGEQMRVAEREHERESDREQERESEREREREREGEGSSTCSSEITRCSTSAPVPNTLAQGVVPHLHTPSCGSPKPVSQKASSLGAELLKDFLHRSPESSPEPLTESEDEVQFRRNQHTAADGPVLSAAKARANALAATSPPTPDGVAEQPYPGRVLFGSEGVEGEKEGPGGHGYGYSNRESSKQESPRQLTVHEKVRELLRQEFREHRAGSKSPPRDAEATRKGTETGHDLEAEREVRNQQLRRAQERARSIVGYKSRKYQRGEP